jgi:hypothetical protein
VGIYPGTSASITGIYSVVGGSTADLSTTDFVNSVDDAWVAGKAHSAATIAAEIGGVTFEPGTYSSGTINIAALTNVTLDGKGDPNSVFIFQSGATMVTEANCQIILSNGAKAENVLWVLGTAFTSGADNVFKGSILAGSAITFGARNVVHGNVIARTAITFGAVNEVHGCVIALTAITFVTTNSVTVLPNS